MIDISLFSEKFLNFKLDLPEIFEECEFTNELYQIKNFSFTAPKQESLRFKNISQLLFSQIGNNSDYLFQNTIYMK